MKLAAIIPALVATLALGACATTQRLSAAPDVHALLVSIRDDDRQAFDAHVDRRALEAQLQARLVARTRDTDMADGWKALGLALSGPVARVAGNLLIQPDVFRAVAEYYGYRPETPIPNSFLVAGALRALPDGRVCATRRHDERCLMTFADEGGTWRLVGFDGDAAMLRMRSR
ncbi:DUF2939 domain-containing protein [Caulobacter sp. KR2-114]|uniref:DUF2939 domain-containing protein n=1 Tax=Caulobacter sp. KR2-114 TaxID=3400912 RepID=UPI003C0E362F